MNDTLREALVREPRPSDANDVRVTLDGPLWRLCWTRDGRFDQTFGPGFAHVSQAAEAARFVREALGL